jgi:SAM-dependent methyltransferase
MDKAEFDRFADEYAALHKANIRLSGEDPDYFAEYKIRDVADFVRARGIRRGVMLDFGCGVGNSVPHVRRLLPEFRLKCLDVSEKSLAIAETRFPGQAEFKALAGDGVIPHEDDSADVAMAACVLHHIKADDHAKILKDLLRVLRPGGTLFVFEHNPWNPLTVHAVNTCPFDENAVLVSAKYVAAQLRAAGFAEVQTRFRIFFPKALSLMRPLERYLTWCPFGAQYYVAATK